MAKIELSYHGQPDIHRGLNMKRTVVNAILILATSALVGAQSPQGWKVRVDRSATASDPDGAGAIKFVTMGTGLHATNPQAAAYWNPANTATGPYTIKGTFTLIKPSGHTNYYGPVSYTHLTLPTILRV